MQNLLQVIINAFIDDKEVALVGVEPAGEGLEIAGRHAATMTKGKFGNIQGFNCYYLQEEDGTPSAVHSIASGLDYPGVGPQHCYLKDLGRGRYETATDQECLDAFLALSRQEGIISALESSHAVAYALRRAKELGSDKRLLVNLSGRGDKDIDFVLSKINL